MTAFLGIDLGTSGVKVLLADDSDNVLAEANASLAVSRPRLLWAEQDPKAWWNATEAALDALAHDRPAGLADVAAIGLSGQMLGVALLDDAHQPLRPALLWSDGRATAECAEIEAEVPGLADLVGCRAMPGFPAPKLRWLSRHEPERLRRARHILLPKDVVRLNLTGEAVTDEADGSATLLMDTRRAAWEPALLSAAAVSPEQLPPVLSCSAISGTVRPALAARWNLPRATPVVAGAGDNMCGAVGAGAVRAEEACIGLGTSAVYVVANDRFLPARGRGMHTHRHAVPGLFVQNGCILSAGAALNWVAALVGSSDVTSLMAEVAAAAIPVSETPVFTPYLAGERTPHDDPALTGTFSSLTLSTTRLHLVQAVLEGVALALGDCHRELIATGARVRSVRLVGGGARSLQWASLIASAIGLPLHLLKSGAYGPALGASRLARAGLGGPLVATDTMERVVEPASDVADQLKRKRPAFGAHLGLAPAIGAVSPL